MKLNAAKAIIEKRKAGCQFIIPAQLREQIGSESFKEALDARWVLPDMDSGHLAVTSNLNLIQEMEDLVTEAASKKCSDCDKKCCDCECDKCNCDEDKKDSPVNESSRNAALMHLNRPKSGRVYAPILETHEKEVEKREKETPQHCVGNLDAFHIPTQHSAVMEHFNRSGRGVLRESMVPGIGKEADQMPPTPGVGPTDQKAAGASNTPSGDGASVHEIGADVTVVHDGKAYQGKVSGTGEEGYDVSFEGDKPAIEKKYQSGEMQVVGG